LSSIITSLSEISDDYDALFVDLWGCVHDGVIAFPAANEALTQYRKKGGKVIFVTNSPKPRVGVEKQLTGFGVSPDAWDSIATSGDSARAAMFQGMIGSKVYFIGEPRDLPFFEPLKFLDNPEPIQKVPLEDAEGIVCTGPFDSTADPEDMRPTFLFAKQKGLKLLCANPDIVVDRGDVREWCAGALAQLYAEMGGESLYFGKPHPPIYNLAKRRLAALGGNISLDRILAIGDGIQTDISGALGEGIDSLFISGGLAKEETKTTNQPDAKSLSDYLIDQKQAPRFTIGYLQ
jgi:HAD superfamily hydrolase (TIGR01459 family)